MTTLKLANGYDRRKHPSISTYRPMTVAEAKRLTYGQEVPFKANDGTARRCRVNGKPKTWKRTNGVEVPVKYGMYECTRLASGRDALDSDPMPRLLVLVNGEGV